MAGTDALPRPSDGAESLAESRDNGEDALMSGLQEMDRMSIMSEPERSGTERIRVVVRIRPTLNKNGELGGAVAISPDGSRIRLNRKTTGMGRSEFQFDKILPMDASQQDVYNAAVKHVVDDVMRGYNGTVMAYGQTGAGKTYTLSNVQTDSIGMIPRAVKDLFDRAASDSLHTYKITMCVVQIYMEQINDLIKGSAENLQLREDESRGVHIQGVTEVAVDSLPQCLHYLEQAERNRTSACTRMNAHSSRSHAVVMLTVSKRRNHLTADDRAAMAQAQRPPGGQQGVWQRVKVGKLYLVDLAGSERLKKSLSTGLRADEAKSINLSLTMLGMCVNARANGNQHVPFRDSKLTRLLQESLGGNAKTSLVVCCSDVMQYCDETINSLQFGSRAMCVRNKPVINEVLDLHLVEALQEADSQKERAYELESLLEREQEERSKLEAALAEEKRRFQAIIDALKAEATQVATAAKVHVERERTKAQTLEERLQGEMEALRRRLAVAQADKTTAERAAERAERDKAAAVKERDKAMLEADRLAKEGKSNRVTWEAERARLQAEVREAQSETEKVRTVAQAMIQTANMNAHLSGKEAHAAAEERAEKAAARATKEVAASREQMQLLKEMHSKELALFRSKVEALKAEHADALAALRTELTFVQEQLWQAQERTADLEGQLAAEVAERQRVERHRDALASTLKTFQAAMRQLASVSSGQDAAGGDSVSDVSSQEDFDQDEVVGNLRLNLESVSAALKAGFMSEAALRKTQREHEALQKTREREAEEARKAAEVAAKQQAETIAGLQAAQATAQAEKSQVEESLSLLQLHYEEASMKLSAATQELADTKGMLVTLQAQSNDLEERLMKTNEGREQLLEMRAKARIRTQAVLTIQRAYRRWRQRVLGNAVEEGNQALCLARNKVLQLQKDAASQKAHLGATMIKESVSVLQDAMHRLLVAFVAPSRELKAQQAIHDRIGRISKMVAAGPVYGKRPGGAGSKTAAQR